VSYWQVPILNKTILSTLYRTLNSVKGNNWSEKSLFSNLIVLIGCSSWFAQFYDKITQNRVACVIKEVKLKIEFICLEGILNRIL
jgi:hypothetical protein